MTMLQDGLAECNIPDGAPTWITPSLLADTIATWRRLSGEDISTEDAVSVLVLFSQLSDLLQGQLGQAVLK
jgi:hypothetical protein